MVVSPEMSRASTRNLVKSTEASSISVGTVISHPTRASRQDTPGAAGESAAAGVVPEAAGNGRGSVARMFTTGFVNLYTADIEAGIRFYRDLLGFEETFRTPREGIPEHVELKLNGFALGLGTLRAAKAAHGVDAAPGSPALAVVLWTDDVDAAFDRLTAAGVRAVQPPRDSGNGNRNALLTDPDGNLVEIVAKLA